MSQTREPSSDQTGGTRDRILITATRLFAEYGYDHTSLAQVAREAHVSKALVLWHFDSKAKLFRAALGRTLEPFYIDVDDLKELDEPTQIERLIDLFYEFVRENVYSVRFMLSLIVRGDKQPGRGHRTNQRSLRGVPPTAQRRDRPRPPTADASGPTSAHPWMPPSSSPRWTASSSSTFSATSFPTIRPS